MARSMRRQARAASGFPPLVERPWTVGRSQAGASLGRCPPDGHPALRGDLRPLLRARRHRGAAMGHAVRSCAIGMRIGEEIGLAPDERSSLFYALLLKDAGCSSNAARLELAVRSRRPRAQAHTQADRPPPARARRCATSCATAAPAGSPRSPAAAPTGAREMTELRCERGADIARMIELSETTAAGDPQPRRALGRRRLPLRPRRRRDPALRPHPLPRPDRGGVLRRRRPARRARRRGRAPRHLVRPSRSWTRCARRAATASSGLRSAGSSRTA